MGGGRNPELARVIAKRMRALREARGESQEEVGFRSGLHRTEISQIERGLRVPRLDTLLKLAGALEVPVGELAGPLAWEPGSYLSGRFTVEAGGEGR
jgi:transcriptional regulator with XRE-family HTH domain